MASIPKLKESAENLDLNTCIKDWTDLSGEYKQLERTNKEYLSKLEELISMQKKCASAIHHQKYRLSAIEKQLNHAAVAARENKKHSGDAEQEEAIVCLKKDLVRRKAQVKIIEETLPQKSGSYLRLILGDINVSILDKKSRLEYKEQYEKFKLYVNTFAVALAVTALSFEFRVLDLLFMFLTVWYYCTLTIRESILKVNGSRIKGWWRAHHFISTFAGGVLLIWPDCDVYNDFRFQLMGFFVYVSFLQYLQFTYQKGVLYRLRSLGERKEMDITVDGFHSWMWKGLGFLMPFLYVGYLWQLWNAYTLYFSIGVEGSTWHVPMLSLVFFVLGLGNLVTTTMTIPNKIKEKHLFKLRFIKLDKYFWNHTRRRRNSSRQNSSIGKVTMEPLTETLKDDTTSMEEADDSDSNKKSN